MKSEKCNALEDTPDSNICLKEKTELIHFLSFMLANNHYMHVFVWQDS